MQAKTPHTVSQGAGVLLGNLPNAVTSAGSTRDFALETSKETGPLKSVYDMRVSHSGIHTRPVSQQKARGKRKHLQSAITRTMAPKLTIPDESDMSGANLLPPMAPNPHKKQQQPGPRLNQNLVGESISNSISNMMNQTSHTQLYHDKTRISGVSVGKQKAMK